MIKRLVQLIVLKIAILRDNLTTQYYRILIESFGEQSWVHGSVCVYYPHNLTVGSNSTLNNKVILDARHPIRIGSHVHLSYGAVITTSGLDLKEKNFLRAHISEQIEIDDGVWIGAGAIILPGAKIGKGAIVAAGAVVTKDVAPFTVVAGVPARIIKMIPHSSKANKDIN